MKKVLCLVVGLLLVMPYMAHAGATSRWDLTIGGTIKFDFGYSDHNEGVSSSGAVHHVNRQRVPEDFNTKYGNWFFGTAESVINFMVKGPDAAGAKTSAVFGIRFDGNPGREWELATIGTTFIRFDWPKTSLLLGTAPPLPGYLPTWAGNQLAYGALHSGIKWRPDHPQITLTQRFGKNFEAAFGLLSGEAFETNNSVNGTSFTRQPAVQGSLMYRSDACGKIGPWKLTLGVAGYYGKEKLYEGQSFRTATLTKNTSTDSWQADFKFYVPLIPEKQGNKTGAAFISGVLFTGQDSIGYGPFGFAVTGPGTTTSYLRLNGDLAAPVVTGYFLHGGYYFTNQMWINAMYWRTKVYASDIYWKRNAPYGSGPDGVQKASQLIVNLMYDVNPAVRVGIQYDRIKLEYGRTVTGFKDSTSQNNYRFGMYYFF